MKIYLAGAFSGWRDNVIKSLSGCNIEFHDPRTDTEQTSICAFTIGDKKYYLLKAEHLLIVGSGSVSVKKNLIEKELKAISAKFINLFKKELILADNPDIDLFSSFENVIRDSCIV